MPFFSRIFDRVRRRRQPVRTAHAAFEGTCVGRRLGLLSYVPRQAELDDARRLADAELQLRESVARLGSAGGDNTGGGLAREVRRTKEQVGELLEEPAGRLPRALTLQRLAVSSSISLSWANQPPGPCLSGPDKMAASAGVFTHCKRTLR